jgi:hypothetical protein
LWPSIFLDFLVFLKGEKKGRLQNLRPRAGQKLACFTKENCFFPQTKCSDVGFSLIFLQIYIWSPGFLVAAYLLRLA